MPYKNKADRKYANATKYESSPKQLKNREERNAARAKLMKAGKVHKGDGMDVDHITPVSKGGTNSASNLRANSAHDNRSFSRNPDHSLKRNDDPKPKRKKKK
jgi:hypothetical protein